MITNGEINQLRDVIVEKFSPKLIYLFGSYAYGTPRGNSDLDLMVLDDYSDDREARVKGRAVHRALAEFPLDIDLIVYPLSLFKEKVKENWSFFSEVSEKGKIIYDGTRI